MYFGPCGLPSTDQAPAGCVMSYRVTRYMVSNVLHNRRRYLYACMYIYVCMYVCIYVCMFLSAIYVYNTICTDEWVTRAAKTRPPGKLYNQPYDGFGFRV